MSVTVPRREIESRLKEAGFRYIDETKRVQIWRQSGNTKHVIVHKRNQFTELQVRTVLSQANLTRRQIEEFLRKCLKDPN